MPPRCRRPTPGSTARAGIDACPPGVDPFVVEELGGRERHVRGIRDVRVAVRERELHGFDEQVFTRGSARGQRAAVEDAQCLERGDALRRRWELGDLEPPVDGPERSRPLPRVRREVGGIEVAAGLLHGRRDRDRDRAAVVRVGSVVRERFDRARHRGLTEDRPGLDVAVDGHPGFEVRVEAAGGGEVRCGFRRDLEAVAGVHDRGTGQLTEAARPPPVEQLEPGGGRTGDGHGIGPDERHALAVAVAHPRRGGRPGRTPRPEIAREIAVVHEREEVASESAPVRRHDAERQVRGDDRVDGVAATREHAETGGGREVVRRGDRRVREGTCAQVGHGESLCVTNRRAPESAPPRQPAVCVKLKVSAGSGGALSTTRTR